MAEAGEFDLMNSEEVARLLNISPKTLINQRAAGRGPRGFRIGRSVMYRREEIRRWLAEQEAADPRGAA